MADPAAKKQRVEEGGDVEEESGPLSVISEQLGLLKEDLEKLNEESSDKVLEIEQQYSKLRRPIYDKRSALLAQIPNFWQQALLHHPELRGFATEDDEAALAFCTEVNVEDFDDIKSGYRIVFRFSENPYFSNTELTKTYNYQPGGTLSIESSMPDWNAGYEPGAEADEDGKRGRANEYKLLDWFNAETDVVASGAVDDIAEIIKEEIWPDPIKYYEADPSEMEALGEDEDAIESESEGFDEEGDEAEDAEDDEGGEEGDE